MKVTSNIYVIKASLWAILVVSAVLELMLFPSLENLIGCAVTFASTWLFFNWVLKIEIIRSRPVCFVAFLQLFLFMYLPLPITLLDGNEMSHDLFIPNQTYILQLLYFSLCVVAFHLSGFNIDKNKVYLWLKRWGYFVQPSDRQLWLLGLIGLAFRLFMMSKQGEDTLAGAGTLNMFSVLIYSPICILFRPLFGKEKCSRKTSYIIYGYIAFLVVLLIATNSRSKMLSPLVVFAFCYLLQQMYTYRNTLWLSYKKMTVLIVSLFVLAGPASDMAIAMVVVRGERTSISFGELLDKSIDAFQDKDRLNAYRRLMEEQEEGAVGADWQESYVSSPFLDRLCNYRVADATIYHAQRVGYGNIEMLEFFFNNVATMFPGPISSFLFPEIDKSDLTFSSMDKLYYLSTRAGVGGYKVGGDVGLGLATFGYSYFPLCFVIYFLVFYILNGVCRTFKGEHKFAIFTLISIYFTYFLMFQVGGGLIAQTRFVLWGFWWVSFWYCLVYWFLRIFRGGKLDENFQEAIQSYKGYGAVTWRTPMKGGAYA